MELAQHRIRKEEEDGRDLVYQVLEVVGGQCRKSLGIFLGIVVSFWFCMDDGNRVPCHFGDELDARDGMMGANSGRLRRVVQNIFGDVVNWL